ncbi:MAG: 2'-deoxycytidine 5'-triphosphate deaminase [Alphaproteobacteria bacterium]|nr:2'-deoxycytidine 5'-triphosphate deaminase [Alphaproteobacteria bacterium]
MAPSAAARLSRPPVCPVNERPEIPATDSTAPGGRRRAGGILPSQQIHALIADGTIAADTAVTDAQVQPASLDLRLGSVAHRVRASFLPASSTVMEKVKALGMHSVDLSQGAVLERGCVYIVPLQERVRMPRGLSGAANPKSSTGRLDVFTRLIADHTTEFDRVRAGYEGQLYAEISPRTFSVLVRTGDRLSQLRFRHGNPPTSDAELRALNERMPLVHSDDLGAQKADIDGGVGISIDLMGSGPDALLGYRAKHHADLIDFSKIAHYDPREFWEPITAAGRAHSGVPSLILNPDDFYILASRERVSVPPAYAAELVPYDPLVGEFRVHYAGFFDPGFGYAGVAGQGTKAVLEVRSHDVPFVLEHGQVVGRLAYERLTEEPDRLYGAGIGSSYGRQALTLSKHFRKD